MLAAVVEALACPTCHAGLLEEPGVLRCENGHAYDIARQGYVTLRGSAGPRHTGDDAEMVAARHELLGSGAYGGLATRLAAMAADAFEEVPPGSGSAARIVVDAGGGTGHYLARVLDAIGSRRAGTPDPVRDSTRAARPPVAGLVLDASPYALRRAAAASPAIAAVGCDLWQRWPLREAVASLVLCVFAPRNGAEARRVLAPGGSLIVVTPGPTHLQELVAALGLVGVDGQKDDRLTRSLEPHLDRHSAESYEESLRLSRRSVATVVAMGPSARHLDADALAAATARLPDEVEVTLSVTLTRWTRP